MRVPSAYSLRAQRSGHPPRRTFAARLLLAAPLLAWFTQPLAAPALLPEPAEDTVLEQVNTAQDQTAAPWQQRLKENPHDEDAAIGLIQHYMDQARTGSDPRYLGYAEAVLADWPETEIPLELRLMRATLQQSLHRFDAALKDLQQIRQAAPRHVQAAFIEASIHLVQGHYEQAQAACAALQDQVSPLILQGCLSQVLARTGQAPQGLAQLWQSYQQHASEVRAQERQWLLVTLAELADQQNDPRATRWWQEALAMAPDDIYARVGMSEQALRQNRPNTVLALTRDYRFADNLMLLRAIALQQLPPTSPARSELASLIEHLEQRFAEARWRGEMLHGREYARYLLQLKGDPEAALQAAQINWQLQREPADTRILLESAQAAGREDVIRETSTWLASYHQQDARFTTLLASTSQGASAP